MGCANFAVARLDHQSRYYRSDRRTSGTPPANLSPREDLSGPCDVLLPCQPQEHHIRHRTAVGSSAGGSPSHQPTHQLPVHKHLQSTSAAETHPVTSWWLFRDPPGAQQIETDRNARRFPRDCLSSDGPTRPDGFSFWEKRCESQRSSRYDPRCIVPSPESKNAEPAPQKDRPLENAEKKYRSIAPHRVLNDFHKIDRKYYGPQQLLRRCIRTAAESEPTHLAAHGL